MYAEVFRNVCLCVFFLLLTRNCCRCAPKVPNSTRTFLMFGYAVYKPGWSLDQEGTFQLWFKTEKQDAMLLYEDDAGEAEQFLDVFLVKGKIRLRMAIGDCSYMERVVNGSFADLKWHKLVIRREVKETIISVDNITANPVKCSAQLSKMVAMYAGYLSLRQRNEGDWVFPTAFWQSMQYGFVGCTRGLRYTYQGKDLKPKLRRTNSTRVGCANPCKEFKCRNGGHCVNSILSAACDCSETGYEGKHCARVIRTTPTQEASTTPSSTTSSSSDEDSDESDERPNQAKAKSAAKASKPNNAFSPTGTLLSAWIAIGMTCMIVL